MATSIDTLILSRRKALPSHDLTGQRFRRVIAATCTAEVEHATRDVRCIGLDTGAHLMFSERRDTGWEGRFFLPHESKAATALNWLMHVQTHENDVRGPWKRWTTMGAESRADWRSRYRYLVKGFLRAAQAYRATRASIVGGH